MTSLGFSDAQPDASLLHESGNHAASIAAGDHAWPMAHPNSAIALKGLLTGSDPSCERAVTLACIVLERSASRALRRDRRQVEETIRPEEARRAQWIRQRTSRLVALGRRLEASLRTGELAHELRIFGADLIESIVRVGRGFRIPTRSDLVRFAGNQLLVNAVAWTAAIVSTRLVQRFFEEKSLGNLWGLLPPSDRSLLDPSEFATLMLVTSYAVGLFILVFVRHLVLRILTELREVRRLRTDPGADGRAEGGLDRAWSPARERDAERPSPCAAERPPAHAARSTRPIEFVVGDALED